MAFTRNILSSVAGLLAFGASVQAAHAADGDALFKMRCQACHKVQAGANGVGPSLAGVGGRKAGTVPGYTYSKALRSSGKTWDKGTLDSWIANSKAVVPGNKMAAPPIKDAAQRAAIVDYLLKLK